MDKSLMHLLLVPVVLVFMCSFNSVEADLQVCKPPEKQHGLVAPILPLNLVTYLQRFDNVTKTVLEARMFIDADNGQVAMITKEHNNNYNHYIIDYTRNIAIMMMRTGVIYDLDAPAYYEKCHVSDVGSAFGDVNLHKMIDYMLEKLILYTRKLVFKEKTTIRGIPADHFTGCDNFKGDQSYISVNVDYYFANLDAPAYYEKCHVSDVGSAFGDVNLHKMIDYMLEKLEKLEK